MNNLSSLARLTRSAVIVATLASLAACGSSATTNSAVGAGATVAQTSPGSSGVAPLLAFSSPLVGGSSIDAASFAGKPVAFWFWAPT